MKQTNEMEEFFAHWDSDINDPSKDKVPMYQALKNKLSPNNNDDNVDLLWRMTRVCLELTDVAEKEDNKTDQLKYSEESLLYAKKAVQCDPNSFEAHKWYCASVGRLSEMVNTKERIELGHEFRQHRDIAVSINPNDYLLNHMHGRWCYEVSSLSYIERKLAETFIANPPAATYKESLESLLLADQQKHEWKLNQLWLAKVYIVLRKYHQAIKYIDYGMSLPVWNEEDSIAHSELTKLQKSYANYRLK